MPDRTPEAPCPPHHWEVTSRRRDGASVEHHRCRRCGAEKDIPFAVAAGRTRQITLRGSRTSARPPPQALGDHPGHVRVGQVEGAQSVLLELRVAPEDSRSGGDAGTPHPEAGEPAPGGAAPAGRTPAPRGDRCSVAHGADDPENGRPIAPGSPRYNARLLRRLDLTGSLAVFWVAPDDAPARFEAGQYFTLGVEVAGTLVQRPYSAASSPRRREGAYEFYVRLVTGGVFTPLLWRLGPGHRLSLGGPKGRFVLTADADRTHLLIATGTGVAPFVSMLRTLRADGLRRRAVVLHGASYAADLGDRAELEAYQRAGAAPMRYIPTISRPWAPENAGWNGRTGRVETLLPAVDDELGLRPGSAVAYLCGNPEMVARVEADLRGRGGAPAAVKTELYWPAGRSPGRAAERTR